MKIKHLIPKAILVFLSFVMIGTILAGTPLWTFTPLTPTTITVPTNGVASILYQITSQSSKPHTLVMMPLPGVVQVTFGPGVCQNPFALPAKGSSCILALQANGSQITKPINNGPIVCQQDSTLLCYRPSKLNILHISKAFSYSTSSTDNIGSSFSR